MKRFRLSSLSIRKKLLGSLALVLAVTVVGTNLFVAGFQRKALHTATAQVSDTLVTSGEHLRTALAEASAQSNSALDAQVTQGGEAIADLLALVAPGHIVAKDFLALLNIVRAVNQNPGVAYAFYLTPDGNPITRYVDKGKAILEGIVKDESGAKRGIPEIIEASRAHPMLRVIEKPVVLDGNALGRVFLCLDQTQSATQTAALNGSFTALVESRENESRELIASVRSTFDSVVARSTALLWAGGGLSMVVVLAIAFWNTSSVTRPLHRLVQMLRDISEGEGDLTVQLEVTTKDELRDVAEGFNRFVAKTRETVDQVKQASLSLATMAEQLSATTTEIATSTVEVSTQAESVATAAEQMSSTVGEVARSASNVSEASADANSAAADGGRVVSETLAAMQEIATVVEGAAQTVGSLGAQSERVSVVLEVIEDIADQTNLLALNAAIEAARAGEHGRGFAVVADEVRKLAEKTVRATQEISQVVGAIQTGSREAVKAMEEGKKRVVAGKELSGEAGSAIVAIHDRVASASGQTEQIAAATEELSTTIRQTATNIDQIASAVGQNSTSIQEISRTVEDLSQRAEELKTLTGRFRT